MISERYHIYSLAAVFFALAIGIVIGTSFGHNEKSAIRQYERWMRVLKTEIAQKGRETAGAKEVASKSEEFCQAALPVVAKGRLAWRNVAVIQTGDYDELTGAVKRALELAGAQVTSVTDISRKFPFDDDEKIRQTLANCEVQFSEEERKPSDELWALIADAVLTGRQGNVLPKLEESGVASFTGDYNRSARLIVLVGGAASGKTNTATAVDAALLAQLSKPNVTVVGCEPGSAASSYMQVWQKTGVATVDNADTAMGQIALVCALNGERAHFGVKESADRLVPQTLETR